MSKPERTINTVDMEAMNSEESEEEMAQYRMKTIFNWKNDTRRSKLTECSYKPELETLNILKHNSEETKSNKIKYVIRFLTKFL